MVYLYSFTVTHISTHRRARVAASSSERLIADVLEPGHLAVGHIHAQILLLGFLGIRKKFVASLINPAIALIQPDKGQGAAGKIPHSIGPTLPSMSFTALASKGG